MIIKAMKRYYIEDYTIIQLNEILQKQYDCKYLVTINNDIVYYADKLKDAKNCVYLQIKESE